MADHSPLGADPVSHLLLDMFKCFGGLLGASEGNTLGSILQMKTNKSHLGLHLGIGAAAIQCSPELFYPRTE